MKFMAKTVAAAVLAVSSVSVFSAVTADGKRFYVDNIIPNFQAVQDNLLQWKTGYNYSCGPTSLLFIDNHYVRKSTGNSPPHLRSLDEAKKAIGRIYTNIGISLNSSKGTELTQLRTIARDYWGYANTRRMDASAKPETNLDNLITTLRSDYPALATLNPAYKGYPLPGSKIPHIVIIFAYNKQTDEFGRAWNHPQNTRKMDLIEYYEPYYGYMRTVPRKDVLLPAETRAFDLANFAYLQLGR